MPKKGAFTDITGQRFGRWEAKACVRKAYRDASGRKFNTQWRCECDCGNAADVSINSLLAGTSQSCGCLKVDMRTVHGLSGSEMYGIWNGILHRCNDQKHEHFDRYGGRGIKMHPQWENDIAAFCDYIVSTIGERPSSEHTIDRIDNDKGYVPGNIQWATWIEQANNRSNSRLITWNDTTLSITEWCERLGLSRPAVSQRINKLGWSVERALTTATAVPFMRRRAKQVGEA